MTTATSLKRSVQRRLSRRLFPSSTVLLLGLIAFSVLLIWTTGFHTFVCTSSVRVSLNEAQLDFKSNVHRGSSEPNADAARHDCVKDFETGISLNDTAMKHMFRANYPLEDSVLVYRSSYFKPRPQIVNPLMTDYIIDPQNVCGNGSAGAPFLLVMIPSLSHHILMRQTIRRTWGSVVHSPWPGTVNLPSVKIVFVFGRTEAEEEEEVVLKAESQRYGDVLYVDFVDSYRNLTYKSLTSLHWASTRCPDTKFVMKVDEDTFVNVPYLLEYLHYHRRELTRTVVGYANPKPVCVRTGKWAVNFNSYPLSVFPRYFYGHSYVISSDVIKDIVTASQHLPFIPVEDASVTGVLAYVVNATRLHNSLFAVSRRSYTCAILNNVKITITMLTEFTHMIIWRAVQRNACTYTIFPTESKIRRSPRKDSGSADNVMLVNM
ncbi:beta-1,3-galactosyltransferase 1-like [Littorina saxatilis]|uniref:Hexosyltransferase n=1 Tax=Littorina saxatilis TaxID=31220 RepID=A0AAN9BZ05_9CAEN